MSSARLTNPAGPPPPNFNVLARPYRWLELLTFGHALHRARTSFLPQLDQYRRALVLGDGDGRFTAALLASNRVIHIDAVDLSPAMLQALTHTAQAADPTASSRLRTYCADARTFIPPPETRYNLIVTHFFLDCLTTPEIHRLGDNLRPYLAPEAAWLLSDFRIPPGLLRVPARVLIRSLYLAFSILTGLGATRLPDHAAALQASGFVRTTQRLSLAGILTAELWRLASRPHHGSTLPSMSSPSATTDVADPLPDPEPPSPSLPEPDPGVFHHDPAPHAPPAPAKSK